MKAIHMVKDQGIRIEKPEGTDIDNFKIVQYNLFADLIGENLTPDQCVKKYRLPIDQIRKIMHKDSVVTEGQFKLWRKAYEEKKETVNRMTSAKKSTPFSMDLLT